LSTETDERRKALADGLAFAINAVAQSGSLLNPSELAVSALDAAEGASNQREQQFDKQEAELRAMANEIQNLKATYEEGKLAVYLDKKTTLDLIERMLKRYFATREAATTATFKIDLGPYTEKDHDGELVLANRSIYVKFVPEGRPVEEVADSYLERARSRNPSEYWLFAPSEEKLDIPFEPVFTEIRILRGRLRTFGLATIISEIVGPNHDVVALYDGPEGYKFIVSKKTAVPAKA